MKKYLLGLMLFFLMTVSVLLGGTVPAEAGNFVEVADTGVLELKSNEKWEKEYRTKMGDVKIRFRNLANSKENKRYHLIIWWRDPGSRFCENCGAKNALKFCPRCGEKLEEGSVFCGNCGSRL